MIPHGGLKSTKKVQSVESQEAEQSAQIRQYVSIFIEHLCRKNNAHGLSD